MVTGERRAMISVERAREICREIAASKGAVFFGLEKHPEPLMWTVIFVPVDNIVTRCFTNAGGDETAFRQSVLATVFDDQSG
jgi:hypothetical protein